MFECKPASFYTSYFNDHPDFVVKEDFIESKNTHLYVGVVEVRGAVHELILGVTIPKSFPHQKLSFYTNSISGYSHLILVDSNMLPFTEGVFFDRLKSSKAYWFCLNSPFAETAEEQLEVEIARLKEWVRRNMHEELPAHIVDEKVQYALRVSNAYEWENPDEIGEISGKPKLTFIGDFAFDIKNFEQRMGHLHCVRTKDDRYYALADEALANSKFPYILVDELPSIDVLKDLVALLKRNGWGEAVFKHLLPPFSRPLSWREYHSEFKTNSSQEAQEGINRIREKLDLKEVSLPAFSLFNQEGCFMSIVGETTHKLSSEQIDGVKKTLAEIESHIASDQFPPRRLILGENDDEEEWELMNLIDKEILSGKFHCFALGYPEGEKLSWLLLGGNNKSERFDLLKLDVGFANLYMSKLASFALAIGRPEEVDNAAFWGRGSLSKNFQEKRIGLIGLGALGSMVAESLARSGVAVAGLWDNDIVEPGNICRSTYSLNEIGSNKAYAIAQKIGSVNPNVWRVKNIDSNFTFSPGVVAYDTKGFYSNINYLDQEYFYKLLQEFDVIIDCTGSNELLHFLSYAAPQITLISLCITNHANELLCMTNKIGNPFELRKSYLCRIEQDTKNYYVEGKGCYAPTFLAKNCDISSLVNLVIRELDLCLADNRIPESMIFSHDRRGVLIDRLIGYKAEGYDIWLTVPSEVLMDAEEMPDVINGELGYILGGYSRDGRMVMVTHIVEATDAQQKLCDAFYSSNSVIDYIGDYTYSGGESNTYREETLLSLINKAEDTSINTNNPLLALRNPDGSVSFFLYMNASLVPFLQYS